MRVACSQAGGRRVDARLLKIKDDLERQELLPEQAELANSVAASDADRLQFSTLPQQRQCNLSCLSPTRTCHLRKGSWSGGSFDSHVGFPDWTPD